MCLSSIPSCTQQSQSTVRMFLIIPGPGPFDQSLASIDSYKIAMRVTTPLSSCDSRRYEDNPTLPGHQRLFYMQCTLSALAFVSCVLIYLNYHLCSFNRNTNLGGHPKIVKGNIKTKCCSCGWRVDRRSYRWQCTGRSSYRCRCRCCWRLSVRPSRKSAGQLILRWAHEWSACFCCSEAIPRVIWRLLRHFVPRNDAVSCT